MVRAILTGQKTQTRRILKPQPELLQLYEWRGKVLHDSEYRHWCWNGHVGADNWDNITTQLAPHLRWKAGDRLWVRETCRAEELDGGQGGVRYLADDTFLPIESTREAADDWVKMFHYRGRGAGRVGNPVGSIHVPRWASRITLAVTAVRVERLQDITEEAAQAEGIYWSKIQDGWCSGRNGCETVDYHAAWATRSFEKLWEAINGAGSWDANPWVAVVAFDRVPNG
jgi:hypothetical protein